MTQKYDPTEFPPFAVTTDLVVLTVRQDTLNVLTVTRSNEPFAGQQALPGGFVAPDTDLIDNARTTLTTKTGVDIDTAHLEQLASYGAPLRDPRMRIVSVAYLALLPELPEPADESSEPAHWTAVDGIGELAFDHNQILVDGIERARAKLEYTTLGLTFCRKEFTMTELRNIYEAVWGISLDPANFHRKATGAPGFVTETGNQRKQDRGRPATLYKAGPAKRLDPPLHR